MSNMRRTRPHRLQDIEAGLRRAYRDWQAPPLHPPQRPPGLSQLPTPTRNTTMATPIPPRVDDYGAIPARLRPIYQRMPDGERFEVDAAGSLLSKYRAHRAAEPHEPAPPVWRAGRKPELTKQQWSTLIAVAEPGAEREHFMRAAALKHITIKD
jgi:hypothetical protein